MTNQEMAEYVVAASNVAGGKYKVTQLQARFMLQKFRAGVIETLKKGGSVQLAGVGQIKVRKAAARVVVHPKTGVLMNIPRRKVATLRLSQVLKEQIR